MHAAGPHNHRVVRIQETTMKPLTTLIVCACAALALAGCGSSDEGSSSSQETEQAPASAQDQAASQVCSARKDIQAQAETLTTLSEGSATKAGVTSALTAVKSDVQKIKAAQPDLAPERKQQVQDAVTTFESQLKTIVQDAVAGLLTSDAKTQATNAAASLKSAVKESLQPIQC
jgi:hypothetical protein